MSAEISGMNVTLNDNTNLIEQADAEPLAVIAPVGLGEQRNRIIVLHALMIAARRSLREAAHPAALAYLRCLLRSPRRLTLRAVPSRKQSLKAKGEDSNGSDTVWRTKRKREW